MQRFEEPHATREPQFAHPCYIALTVETLIFDQIYEDYLN